MKVSIIGLPQSGVTTVFHALTARREESHAHARPDQPTVAVVKVPDARLDFLAGLYHPKKVTHASVEFLEVPGLFSATAGGASSDSAAAAIVRDSDACLKVLRAFDSDAVPNPRGASDPARDLRDMDDELLTLDLAVIEKRIARLEKDLTKPLPAAEQEPNRAELAALRKCLAALEAGQALDHAHLFGSEQKLLRGFRFLTQKPCIHVVNVNESDAASPAIASGVPAETAVAFCAKIEDEIEQLDEQDRAEFLAALGITELARDRIIRKTYGVLGLISFFTVVSDELRAWTLPAGSTVLDAAAAIHSDLARGFIKAEVMKFGDLERLGSEREVKAHGLARLEGRDCTAQDGDIVHIRFHV